MDKLNVLMVHNYYKIPGGEDTVVESESNMLKTNGNNVVLYTRNNHELENLNALKKIKLFFETIYSFKTYKEVKKIIKEKNIDIVHVHNTLPLISPSVYYAAKNCNTPVVQTIHNFRLLCPGATLFRNGHICEECIEKGLGCSLKHKCYRNSFFQTLTVELTLKIHRAINTFNKVNGYIALTEFNKKKLSNVIKNKDKIFVKPNFVNNKDYIKSKNREIEDYYVFIGRLDNLKGIDLIVNAWKEVKTSHLYIIGDGDEKVNIENFIRTNNIKNIKLLGFMKRENAFNIIKKCKAIIMASKCYEGFPMVILEAFSYGVPVIANNINNLSSIISDENNGLLFKYQDKEDLVNKINMLNNDKNLLIKLGNEAKETYKKIYTEEVNYKMLSNIYEQLLGDNNEKM